MKDYERLTNKDHNGFAYPKIYASVRDCVHRLADLEDKIESETLIDTTKETFYIELNYDYDEYFVRKVLPNDLFADKDEADKKCAELNRLNHCYEEEDE